jgi:hypothetical protein
MKSRYTDGDAVDFDSSSRVVPDGPFGGGGFGGNDIDPQNRR